MHFHFKYILIIFFNEKKTLQISFLTHVNMHTHKHTHMYSLHIYRKHFSARLKDILKELQLNISSNVLI